MSGLGSGIVGYDVQTAVDAEHHLIVAHAAYVTPIQAVAVRPYERDAHAGPSGLAELSADFPLILERVFAFFSSRNDLPETCLPRKSPAVYLGRARATFAVRVSCQSSIGRRKPVTTCGRSSNCIRASSFGV
jgi:hypothetical protein